MLVRADDLDARLFQLTVGEEAVGLGSELLRLGVARDHVERPLLESRLGLHRVLVEPRARVGLRSTAARATAHRLAQLGVVARTQCRAAQRAVRLDEALEDRGRRLADLDGLIDEAIGMTAQREIVECLLDLGLRRVERHPEDVVVMHRLEGLGPHHERRRRCHQATA